MERANLSPIEEWWDAFNKEPVEALHRLLSGVAYMGRLNSNETDEILFRLFHNKGNKMLRRLDEVMKEWFETYLGKIPASMSSSRWARILQNSFIAVYRLNLGETYLSLKDFYIRDKSWLRSLYNGPARDPEGELLRTLALCQKDQKLLPLWIRLCQWEEDIPIDYTSIGLLGLRKLPDKNGEPPGDIPKAFFKGVVDLAEAMSKKAKPQYKYAWLREMRAVTARYPRALQYWADHFSPYLSYKSDSPSNRWLNEVIPGLSDKIERRRSLYLQPPSKQRFVTIVKLVKDKPLNDIRLRLDSFFDQHRAYAYQTGDSYFLVMTFSNIGNKIFRQNPAYALGLLEEAFTWAPYDPYIWSQRALIEAFRGNLPRAMGLLWEAKRRFPENPEIRNELAKILGQQGRYEIPEALCRQTMEDFPSNVVCRNGLAELLKSQDKLDEAEEVYRQTMKDFPSNAVCHTGLAEVLKSQKKLHEAEKIYRQTMKDFPANVVCRTGLAELLKSQEKFDEAEEVYRQTMKDFPSNVVCRNGLAELLKSQDKLDAAEKVYRQTMKDFPRNVVCRAGLAEVLKSQKKFDEAESVYRQAMDDFPTDVVCRNGLAVVLVKLRKKDEAIELLEETLEKFPGNEVAKGFLEKIATGRRISAEDEKKLEKEISELDKQVKLPVFYPFENGKGVIVEGDRETQASEQMDEYVIFPVKGRIADIAEIQYNKELEQKTPEPMTVKPPKEEIEIGEVETTLGEMSLVHWQSRRVENEEKEKYRAETLTVLEKILKKAPQNIPALLVKGFWLADADGDFDRAGEYLSKQAAAHPNTLGFHLMELRVKGLLNKEIDNAQWSRLIQDFSGRSTVIKLEHTMCEMNNGNGRRLHELEQLRKQILKGSSSLPVSLQKNEEWVRSTIKQGLFKDIDTEHPVTGKSFDTIERNYRENEIMLKHIVEQCVSAAI
jgi:tetratricopeptide (TPR) repeat protein